MGRSRAELAELVSKKGGGTDAEPDEAARRALIYGVTTGFGYFKSRPLDSVQAAEQIQINVLRSHAVGVGPPMPIEVVRAMLLLRLRTFVEGRSAVRPAVLELLVEMLNRQVHPWVPQQGSVSASGDLCPLAHLGLALIGEGQGWLGGGGGGDEGYATGAAGWDVRTDRRPPPRPMREVLAEAGLANRVLTTLAPKEGLALTNGTSASAAVAALAVYDAGILYGTANLAAACSLQALRGATRAFDPKVQAVRGHAGQQHAAAQIEGLARGGSLLDTSGDVQDAYSLRCAPAVHGAALTAIEHAWSVIEREINAVTDNPLFFDPQSDGAPCDNYAASIWDAYAAGNFHAEPVGLVADYLKIAVAELASISERRLQYLLDENHSRGLPANLWPDAATAGLNSGLMITQYTAAALVSENKVLAHPASVDSIPTSSNSEDHVSMALIAARHARQVNVNTRHVLAIELLAALQALELRQKEDGGAKLSPAAQRLLDAVRAGASGVPSISHLSGEDRILWPDQAALAARIASGALCSLLPGA